LISLVFPASLGLSGRIEDHVTVFRVGTADSYEHPRTDGAPIFFEFSS
jgi:hypothetical protein